MFKLDNDFLISLGLGGLPVDEKNKLLQVIYERLEMNVGMRLAERMTDAQLDEFEGFIDRNDEAGALRWLETNFPNYKDVVAEELEKLKAEVSASAPQILSAAQAQAGQAQSSPASGAQPGMPQQTMPQQPYNNPQNPYQTPSPQYGPVPAPQEPPVQQPAWQPAPTPAAPSYSEPPSPAQPFAPQQQPSYQQPQQPYQPAPGYQQPQAPQQQPPAGPSQPPAGYTPNL